MLSGPWESLEDLVAKTNAGFFLKEFSFANTKFRPPGATELELADHVVCFDDVLMIFQLKQRNAVGVDPEAEDRWFADTVVRKATRQVRSTLECLKTKSITLANDRGHAVGLGDLSGRRVFKLVVYAPGPGLQSATRQKKCHVSSTGGLIHLLHVEDYVGVFRALVTLPEIVEYLEFRDRLCQQFPGEVGLVREQAVLGQFLAGAELVRPAPEYEHFVARLKDDARQYEIFAILHQLNEKTYSQEVVSGTPDAAANYYKILLELLRLPRLDLGAFKQRFTWTWEMAGSELVQPSRFLSTVTGCAFVFVPVPRELEHVHDQGLRNFTGAAKYDLKADRCIGISMRRDGDCRLVDWIRWEYPWEHDPQLEEQLRVSNPFRPVRLDVAPRYTFQQ